ncbi:MAG: tetratricopeptide repeat protein [Gemmatimonas sp.]
MIRAYRFAVRYSHGALFAAVVVLSSACSGPDVPKTPLGAANAGGSFVPGATDQLPPGLNASAAARLDSGNIAFRLKQYDQAMKYYEAAAKDVPDHAAPWYGIYMVGQATGNTALADSATRAVAKRTGGGDLLDTGLVKAHGGAEKTPPPLPKKHP